jgi:hypothetical protein
MRVRRHVHLDVIVRNAVGSYSVIDAKKIAKTVRRSGVRIPSAQSMSMDPRKSTKSHARNARNIDAKPA